MESAPHVQKPPPSRLSDLESLIFFALAKRANLRTSAAGPVPKRPYRRFRSSGFPSRPETLSGQPDRTRQKGRCKNSPALLRSDDRLSAAKNTRASTGASEMYTMKSNHSTTSPIELKSTDHRTLGTLPSTRTLRRLSGIREKVDRFARRARAISEWRPRTSWSKFPSAILEKNR